LRKGGYLPPVDGLFDSDQPAPNAILLSHAHVDHVGLLSRSREEIPVYASKGTSQMMLAGAVHARQDALDRRRHRQLEPERTVTIGDFQVTGFPVDHSIHGSMALLLEAGGKRVLYSGDLRINHGNRPELAKRLIESVRECPIDALIMEGTLLGFGKERTKTEQEVQKQIAALLDDAPSLVLASFSPQNVERLRSFRLAAAETGRTFAVDEYTAMVMHLVHGDGRLPQPRQGNGIRVLYPRRCRDKAGPPESNFIQGRIEVDWIEIDEVLCRPRGHLMVFRQRMLEDEFQGQLPEETRLVFSYWAGYLDQPGYDPLKQALAEVGGKLERIHASGHAPPEDLCEFVRGVRPKKLIPIHTFEPTAFEEHFDNVHGPTDGQSMEI